jgi:transposase-like protein
MAATREHTGLPEDTAYRDTGCSYHPACLTCPLVRCRFDAAPGVARAEGATVALLTLLRAGRTVEEVASAIGVSRRTVYRLRRRAVEVA